MFSMLLGTLILAIRDTAAIWMIWMIAGYMVTLETKIRHIITTRERVAVERDDWWNHEIVYVERVATDDLEEEWEVVTNDLDEDPEFVTDELDEEWVEVN